MKTIGLLGGMSWESTLEYYKIINETVNKKLGKLHSAKIVMISVDFEPIEVLQHKGDWDGTAYILSKSSKDIEAANADFLVICTNTMHKVVPKIEKHISIPILHIADATAQKLKDDNIKKVALLGTSFTMEQDFYKQRLTSYGLEVMIPETKDRKTIHSIIYDELCMGIINKESKIKYIDIINKLIKNGAQGVILGCTEIGMLIKQEDVDIKVYDTTLIHAQKAVEKALEC
ncbi:MAG: aspartate/glutamate racemase family protein [Campylobacterota bacterium]|nr:aspartate/glutamate racemase family protein [Campylobacterota bacterium]